MSLYNEFHSALQKEEASELPLSSFQAEDLLEKLKLLNYEKLFSRDLKIKPFNKFYFIKSTNPGEEFYVFSSLSAWLIRKLGKNFPQPQEFDDPNVTISKIVQILQEMDIPTDFPNRKLIQGAGPICLFVLDCLATHVLRITKITLQKPIINEEKETLAKYVENDSEIILERLEEEQNAYLSDDSDAGVNSMLDINLHAGCQLRNSESPAKFSEVENWRLELERVLPHLKVVVKADPRDWRAHLEQMKNLRSSIESSTEETQLQLRKMQSDISFAMEKIESREKHLNNDLYNLIKQFKDVSMELANMETSIHDTEEERQKLGKELAIKIDENEEMKSRMEQRGSSMSDGSPIINIKKAISKLKDEISYMNLEIGLLTHALDQDILRQASLYAELETMQNNIE